MIFTKPILAAPLLPPHLEHTDANIFGAMKQLKHWPVLATLKKDGIRAIRANGSLVSRTLKPIPNHLLRSASIVLPAGFDMELWRKDLDYCDVESIVMSREHPLTNMIEYHILDWFGAAPSYAERCTKLCQFMYDSPPSSIKFAPPIECQNAEQLFALFRTIEEEAGEGVCFRTPTSPYKQGRSTLNEQYLVKLCRNITAEATVIGFKEQMANTNPPSRNAVGSMDRSSHGHRLLGKNTLGALEVRGEDGVEFSIGTGFTDVQRSAIWRLRDTFLGCVCTYKCKQHGKKIKPRSPVWKGWRNDI